MNNYELKCLTCAAVLGSVFRASPPEDSGLLCEPCQAEASALLLDMSDGSVEQLSLYAKFTSYLSRLFGK